MPKAPKHSAKPNRQGYKTGVTKVKIPLDVRRFLENLKHPIQTSPPSKSVAQVFDTPELVLLIASHCSIKDLLRLKLVRIFNLAIMASPTFRSRLFLGYSIKDEPQINPYYTRVFSAFVAPSSKPIAPIRIIRSSRAAIQASLENPQASWREMLVCKPPATCIKIYVHKQKTRRYLNTVPGDNVMGFVSMGELDRWIKRICHGTLRFYNLKIVLPSGSGYRSDTLQWKAEEETIGIYIEI